MMKPRRLSPLTVLMVLGSASVVWGQGTGTVFDALSTNAPTATPPAAAAPAPAPASTSQTPQMTEQVVSTLQEVLQLMNQGQSEAALGKVTSVLKIDPNNLDGLIIRGNIYVDRKNWDLARNDYSLALKQDPNNFTVKFNLAEIKFRQKQYDSARPDFLALEVDPDFSDLASYKVFLCDLFGAHEDIATKDLAVFNQAGGNPSYYFGNAAWSLFHGKPEDARGWLASATNIYAPKKIFLYASSLKDLGYLPLPPKPADQP